MATTTNFGWETPDDTDYVSQGAAAMRELGQDIDTSLVDLKGGTTGQLLSKNSNTDLDYIWVDPNAGDITGVTAGTGLTGGGTSGTVTVSLDTNYAIPPTIFDAAGDLIVASAADTAARLAIGTTGQVLTSNGTTATWATPAGGGKVLQVVAAYTGTATTSSSSTYIDTTLTANITPSSTSSKVLILVSQNGCVKGSQTASNGIGLRLLRGASNLITFAYEGLQTNTTIVNKGGFSTAYLDSPATTSSTTYKTMMANTGSNNASVTANENASSSIILIEIGA